MTRGSLGPHFRAFWVASAVSNLGDGVRITALPLLAAAITRDPQAVAATQVFIWVPQLLFGLLGGAVIDRVDRRVLVRNFQLVRGVAVAGLAYAAFAGEVTLPMIYATAFVIGFGEVFVDAAAQTIARSLLDDDQLETGYGRLWAVDVTANELLGPPVGGLIFGITRWVPFAIDAVSFGLAGFLVHRLPADLLAKRDRSPSTLRADIGEGLRALWSIELMRYTTLFVTAHGFLSSLSWAIYVLFALEVLDTDAAGFGLLISAGGVGGLLATFIASRLAVAVGRGPVLWVSTVISGLTLLLIGFTSNVWVAGALHFVMIFSISLWNVVARALRATIVPDRLLGRVVASGRFLAWGAIPLGSAAGGLMAQHYGLRWPFYIGGALIVVVGLAMAPGVTTEKIEEARAAGRGD